MRNLHTIFPLNHLESKPSMKFIQFTRSIIILFIFQVSVVSGQIQSDVTDSVFQTIKFRVHAVSNINDNIFHQYWDPQYGTELQIDMPFYSGIIEGGVHLYPYNGRENQYVDFLVQYYYVGWGINLPVYSQISWYNGLRFGNYLMSFDDEDINPTQVNESELGFGLNSRLELGLSRRWNIDIGIGYLVVYTKKRLELTMISIGFSYMIDSPQWIKDFLK